LLTHTIQNKQINLLTMGFQKIYVCWNHCTLYRGKDYEVLEKAVPILVPVGTRQVKIIRSKRMEPAIRKGRSEKRPKNHYP